MRRVFALAVIASIAVTGRAQAIEMFTNFNNGQNIGFPPLEVPTRIYGGFGRGGWNPHAEGMPLKTNPPVPAMMPTGQIPGRAYDYYGRAPGVMTSNDGTTSSRQLVSDRRRSRWQRGSTVSDSDRTAASRRATSSDVAANQSPAGDSLPTILHAQSEDFSSAATRPVDFQDWPKADALFPH